MKRLITILTIMTATTTMAQNGKATTVRATFHRTTTVSTDIKADPSIVWKLLTDAGDFPRWNSTVISIEGRIAAGEKLRLKSTLAPKRTFKMKVKQMETGKNMTWGDGQGHRLYTLVNKAGGITTFTMTEKIGGLMFPLYAGHIPSFDQSFEQFAADLKKEAELIQNVGK